MSVTLQTIAEQLDVSAATVSRSLRHDRLIHPKTRARVNEMALRLGYTERSRRPRNKTEGGTMGFLLRMDTLADAQHDPNVMRMMEGVMSCADSMGLLLNVHGISFNDTRSMAQDPTVVPPMIRDHVCHSVIVNGSFADEDIAFIAQQMPVVCLNRIYRQTSANSVVADDVEGVRALTEHLTKLGHRRLAWVNDYYDATFFEARQTGFIQGCLGNGLLIGEQLLWGKEAFENRRLRITGELVQAVKDGVTAIVCANDFVAKTVMEALEAVGLKIPGDVSITGFDALPTPENQLPITSFDPNFFEMGRAAVRLAAQQPEFTSTPPSILSIRGQIVEGETVAPPPK